ncbi:hypothetical protein Cadr_000013280 [Camelus dromedarius]|uniref:Uncharacterized protein n=1 Tax=Camelus dromedarius TaxID=9838 RepID=A0A5N4DDX8_CAMDR|nr:hypothetical protein Cadr_000013280 [Camelus dromedarius]
MGITANLHACGCEDEMMHSEHLAQCLARGKLWTPRSCCYYLLETWLRPSQLGPVSHVLGPQPPLPHGLTLSRESSVETDRRENSSTTKAATRTPTTVRIRASPARCTVSSEAHLARSRSFSSCRSGLLGAEPLASAMVGGPGAPSHTLAETEGVVSSPHCNVGRWEGGLGVWEWAGEVGTHLAQTTKKPLRGLTGAVGRVGVLGRVRGGGSLGVGDPRGRGPPCPEQVPWRERTSGRPETHSREGRLGSQEGRESRENMAAAGIQPQPLARSAPSQSPPRAKEGSKPRERQGRGGDLGAKSLPGHRADCLLDAPQLAAWGEGISGLVPTFLTLATWHLPEVPGLICSPLASGLSSTSQPEVGEGGFYPPPAWGWDPALSAPLLCRYAAGLDHPPPAGLACPNSSGFSFPRLRERPGWGFRQRGVVEVDKIENFIWSVQWGPLGSSSLQTWGCFISASPALSGTWCPLLNKGQCQPRDTPMEGVWLQLGERAWDEDTQLYNLGKSPTGTSGAFRVVVRTCANADSAERPGDPQEKPSADGLNCVPSTTPNSVLKFSSPKKSLGHRHAQRDTGRRWPLVSQGERPQRKPTLLTPCSQPSSLQNYTTASRCTPGPPQVHGDPPGALQPPWSWPLPRAQSPVPALPLQSCVALVMALRPSEPRRVQLMVTFAPWSSNPGWRGKRTFWRTEWVMIWGGCAGPWVDCGAGLTTAVYTLPELWQGLGLGPLWGGHSQLERAVASCQVPSCVRSEGCHLGALVLAPPGQFPELIPEEHAEDGVGAQAQVGGAQTLVERQRALLPPDLHQAVGEATIQLALERHKADVITGVGGPGWHNGDCLCEGFCGTSEKALPSSWENYIKLKGDLFLQATCQGLSLASGSQVHFTSPMPSPTLSPAHPARSIHGLIVQACADHIEGGHDCDHSYAADHASSQGHQPALPSTNPPWCLPCLLSTWGLEELGEEGRQGPSNTPHPLSPLSSFTASEVMTLRAEPGPSAFLRGPVCHHPLDFPVWGPAYDVGGRQEALLTPVCLCGWAQVSRAPHLFLLHPGLGGGKADHDSGHGPTHTPPQPCQALLPPDGLQGTKDALWGEARGPHSAHPAQGALGSDGPHLVMVLVPHGHGGHCLGLQLRWKLRREWTSCVCGGHPSLGPDTRASMNPLHSLGGVLWSWPGSAPGSDLGQVTERPVCRLTLLGHGALTLNLHRPHRKTTSTAPATLCPLPRLGTKGQIPGLGQDVAGSNPTQPAPPSRPHPAGPQRPAQELQSPRGRWVTGSGRMERPGTHQCTRHSTCDHRATRLLGEASLACQAVAVEADAVHEALVEEASSQPLLQATQPICTGHRDYRSHKAPVVPRVGAPGLQLPLQLQPRLHHLQGVGEDTGQATGRGTQHQVHSWGHWTGYARVRGMGTGPGVAVLRLSSPSQGRRATGLGIEGTRGHVWKAEVRVRQDNQLPGGPWSISGVHLLCWHWGLPRSLRPAPAGSGPIPAASVPNTSLQREGLDPGIWGKGHLGPRETGGRQKVPISLFPSHKSPSLSSGPGAKCWGSCPASGLANHCSSEPWAGGNCVGASSRQLSNRPLPPLPLGDVSFPGLSSSLAPMVYGPIVSESRGGEGLGRPVELTWNPRPCYFVRWKNEGHCVLRSDLVALVTRLVRTCPLVLPPIPAPSPGGSPSWAVVLWNRGPCLKMALCAWREGTSCPWALLGPAPLYPRWPLSHGTSLLPGPPCITQVPVKTAGHDWNPTSAASTPASSWVYPFSSQVARGPQSSPRPGRLGTFCLDSPGFIPSGWHSPRQSWGTWGTERVPCPGSGTGAGGCPPLATAGNRREGKVQAKKLPGSKLLQTVRASCEGAAEGDLVPKEGLETHCLHPGQKGIVTKGCLGKDPVRAKQGTVRRTNVDTRLVDMQGLLVAREGQPGPLHPYGPWKAGSRVLGDGVGEKTCTEISVFQLPSQPGPPGRPKPLPGPLTQGRKKAVRPPSPSAPFVDEGRGSREEAGSDSLPPALPSCHLPARRLRMLSSHSGSQGGRPCLEPHSCVMGRGWEPGPEQLGDTAMTVRAARCAPLSCPAGMPGSSASAPGAVAPLPGAVDEAQGVLELLLVGGFLDGLVGEVHLRGPRRGSVSVVQRAPREPGVPPCQVQPCPGTTSMLPSSPAGQEGRKPMGWCSLHLLLPGKALALGGQGRQALPLKVCLELFRGAAQHMLKPQPFQAFEECLLSLEALGEEERPANPVPLPSGQGLAPLVLHVHVCPRPPTPASICAMQGSLPQGMAPLCRAAGYLVDGFPPGVQCRQESVQFRCAAQVDDPGREGLLAILGKLLRYSAPSAGPASIACHPIAHQDTVLLAQVSGDGTDVGQLGGAQGAEEAGLAILVACEEAVVSDHQAAGDTGARSYPLGDDLKGIGRGEGRGKLELSMADLHQDSHSRGQPAPQLLPQMRAGADRGDGGGVRPLSSRGHSWAGGPVLVLRGCSTTRVGWGTDPGGPEWGQEAAEQRRQEALTPLDTAWQRCCIQSAISASLSALSSRQGRRGADPWCWISDSHRTAPPWARGGGGEPWGLARGVLTRHLPQSPEGWRTLEDGPDTPGSQERLKAAGQLRLFLRASRERTASPISLGGCLPYLTGSFPGKEILFLLPSPHSPRTQQTPGHQRELTRGRDNKAKENRSPEPQAPPEPWPSGSDMGPPIAHDTHPMFTESRGVTSRIPLLQGHNVAGVRPIPGTGGQAEPRLQGPPPSWVLNPTGPEARRLRPVFYGREQQGTHSLRTGDSPGLHLRHSGLPWAPDGWLYREALGSRGKSPPKPLWGRVLLELQGLPPEHHEARLPVLLAQVGGARLVMQHAFFAMAGDGAQGFIQGKRTVTAVAWGGGSRQSSEVWASSRRYAPSGEGDRPGQESPSQVDSCLHLLTLIPGLASPGQPPPHPRVPTSHLDSWATNLASASFSIGGSRQPLIIADFKEAKKNLHREWGLLSEVWGPHPSNGPSLVPKASGLEGSQNPGGGTWLEPKPRVAGGAVIW